MSINHSGRQVRVAEEFLNGPDIYSVLQKVGGKGVSEGVAGDAFYKAGPAYGFAELALDNRLVEVMAPVLAGFWFEICQIAGNTHCQA